MLPSTMPTEVAAIIWRSGEVFSVPAATSLPSASASATPPR
jgi:hypothetical protein